MLDWARFRNRDFENSLTAYSELISDMTLTNPWPFGSFDPAKAKHKARLSTKISYEFIAMLVHCKMNRSVRAPSYLLLNVVLIDPMDSSTIVFAIRVLRMRM